MTTGRPIVPFISSSDHESASDWIAALQIAMPLIDIRSPNQIEDADANMCRVAIVANPDPSVLNAFPNLVWVHSVWAGVERLLGELGSTPLQIVRLVDPVLAQTMAEAVLAWTMYLHRDMPAYRVQQEREIWRQKAYVPPEQKTIGILGFGELGKAAAQRLQQSRFNVLTWSTAPKADTGTTHFFGSEGLQTMLKQCDILICLLPLTAATSGLLNADKLALLPKGAALINFGRGPILNDIDLRTSLDSGHLSHAVLDVFAVEPLHASSWEWRHPKVTVLPHCSAPTNRQTAAAIVASRVQRYFATGLIPSPVDVRRGY